MVSMNEKWKAHARRDLAAAFQDTRSCLQIMHQKGDSLRNTLPYVPHDVMDNIKRNGRAGSELKNYYFHLQYWEETPYHYDEQNG